MDDAQEGDVAMITDVLAAGMADAEPETVTDRPLSKPKKGKKALKVIRITTVATVDSTKDRDLTATADGELEECDGDQPRAKKKAQRKKSQGRATVSKADLLDSTKDGGSRSLTKAASQVEDSAIPARPRTSGHVAADLVAADMDEWLQLCAARVDSHQQEERITALLFTLLLSQGPFYTAMVESLLKEVRRSSGRLRDRENMRTIVGNYDNEYQWATKYAQGDLFTLVNQNMFYAQEVPTSVQRMRIPAPLACKTVVLVAVAGTANEEALTTNAVEALTEAAWLQLRAGTALDIMLYALAVTCLCLATWGCRYGGMDVQSALWTLAVIQGKEAIEWLAHVGSVVHFLWQRPSQPNGEERRCEHIGGREIEVNRPQCHIQANALDMIADLIFLLVGYFAIVRQMNLCGNRELDQIFLPCFCVMYWLRLLYSLRGERWVGPYVLPILSAAQDTGAFFVVTCICVAGATHAYIILNPRKEDPYPVYSAFTHTVRLAIFGDFDLFEYQGQDPTYAQNAAGEWAPNDPDPRDLDQRMYIYLQLCFFCTGVGVTVLLMNLLVGILGQNYERHQSRVQVLFVQARARMLLEQKHRPWARLAKWLFRESSTVETTCHRPSPQLLCWLAEVALSPLKPIMQPVRGRRSRIFERFLHRAVWRPIANCRFRALVSPVILLLLLPGFLVSLLSLLAFYVVGKLLLTFGGFETRGLRYFINLSIFGLFDDQFADECEIIAVVRGERKQSPEERLDKMDSMISKILDKMDKADSSAQERLDKMESKIDTLLRYQSKG